MGLGQRGARLVVVAVLAAVISPVAARAPLEGDPPIARHLPDVDAYPQNFALAQDLASVVYVGNYDGVLVYDGERWELLRLPNKDLARSLAFDGKDRVYVGGHNLIGYVVREADGRTRYHDLTPLFAPLLEAGESYEDVWDILVARDAVYFRALRHVFRYDPASGATRVWRHAGRFGALVEHNGKVVLQFRGEGLKQLEAGEWQLLPGSEPLSERVGKFLRLPDGGLLAVITEGRWRAFRNGRVQDYPMPPTFPPASEVTAGVEMADGTLVMTSISGWLYTLDPVGGAHRALRLDGGYLTDLIPDRGGGLLVAGEERLLRVEWPSSWTATGEAHGLSASLIGVVRWGDRWHVLSSSGVFAVEVARDGSRRFEPRDWTTNEAWDLLPIDADTALLAESYDVMLVSRGKARALSNGALYPNLLRRSIADPDVVLAGLGPGIAVLRRTGGTWSFVLQQQSESDLEVSSLVETEPHVVWAGTGRGGIWRLQFEPGYRAITEMRRFGPAEGIAFGEPAGASVVQLADGTLVATTPAGIFRWDGTRFARWNPDGIDEVREEGEWVDLLTASDGRLWASSHKNIYRHADGRWHREEIVGVRRGALGPATFDETGAPVFTSTRALLRYAASAPASPADGAPTVLLRAVERHNAGGGVDLLPTQGPLELADGNFGLRVRFALPDFRLPGAARYSTRLVGFDAQSSAWSDVDTLQYPRLPPGTYRLEIKAQDSLGRESHITPLQLRIRPAWYATTMARGLWVVLMFTALGALTVLAVRWRTARLEGLVAARTSELRAANERLDAMAHIDGLTGVSNRRELDRHLERAWTKCQKEGCELAVLAIDVDGFKRYNDQHGHQRGDEMLVRLVREAAACLDDAADLLARYGGDEFFIVRTGGDLPGARALAETLRQRIEAANLGATVSVGVASRVPKAGDTVRELVRAADAALYAAKSAGRNRVAA